MLFQYNKKISAVANLISDFEIFLSTAVEFKVLM